MTERGAQPKGSRTSGSRKAQPEDPATGSAQLWLRLFLLALLAAILTSTLTLPWKVLGLVLALVALAVGVTALVKVIGAKLPRAALIGTSVGLAATLFVTAGTGASVLLWPITAKYEDCMSRALTLQARSDCEDGLQRLEGFGG
jgi:hypothetical protein